MNHKILITEYRGFEIYFNTIQEVFYCFSESFDTESTSKSFRSTKTWIDNFIKDNSEFRPFKVVATQKRYNHPDEITIVGIRKDGLFVYEAEGKKKVVGKYDENSFMLYNPDNDPIKEKIRQIDESIHKLMDEKREAESKLKIVTLSEIKNNYTNK